MEVDLAGYRIDSVIGHGGMATVYRAEQRSLGREVALKILGPELAHDSGFRERFLAESRIAARLDHSGIVPIYDAGESDGVLYIAMRLVPGSDLRGLLRTEGRLSVEMALSVLEQLAAGLEAAHGMGLVHRDVKPGNALIEDGGEWRPRVFLSDFGLARAASEQVRSGLSTSLGSVHYMSPERLLGEEEDARSDVYSLGCLFYECLTGQVPFPRDSGEAISYAHRRAPPPRARELSEGIPPALDEVVAWALAKSPDARPTSALQLAEAAAAAAGPAETSPQPRATAHPAARPLRATVGRIDEEALLMAALRRATSGRGQVILISGEPGIGKTALAQRLCEEAERLGVPTVWGRGSNFGEAPPPYWHWAQVVRSLAGRDDAKLLRGLGPSAGWLAAVAPELVGEFGSFDAAAAEQAGTDGRFHIYDALRLLMERAAGDAGLVVILDDLHLADDASMQALAFAASAIHAGGVLIVGTYRQGELRAATGGGQRGSASLVASLLASSTSVSLAGLDGEQVRRLINARLGAEGTGTLAERVHEVTGGNALFVSELLNLLESQGRLNERLDPGALPLPTGLSEAISQRLAGLPVRARQALEAGAVIGSRFRATTLARATAVPPEELLEQLDDAVSAGLLRAAGTETYAFSHGLVQAALYDALPRRRRCEIHAAVAAALEHLYDARAGEGLAEIAYHFLEAAPAEGGERAVEYARRAADRAVRTFAYDEAVTLYTRALELVDPVRGEDRIELLQALGEALMRVGDTEAARRSLEQAAAAARALGDADGLGRAALASNIWGLTFGIDEPLVRLAEEAVEALEHRGTPGLLASAKGLLASAIYWAREADRRELLAEEALELARHEHIRLNSTDSGRALGYVLGRYLLARWGPRSANEDYGLSDELVTLAHGLRDLELEILARNWRVIELLEMGRFREVDQEIARLQQIATELRQPRAMVFLPLHKASRAGTVGRLGEAERLNAESYEIGQQVRGTIGELAGTAQLLSIRLQQGRLAELEAPLRIICDTHPTMVATQCVLALALVQDGRLAEGRAEFGRLMSQGHDGFPQDNCHIVALAMLGEVAAELDDAGHAAELYSWLEPYAGRWVVSPNAAALWPVSRSLARLATVARSFDAAYEHLTEARDQARAAGAAPSLALVALDEARLLVARDAEPDKARVCALARDARERAQELDMGFVVDGATLLEATTHGDPDRDPE
jgi:tetratricopeptide (TPR) repeat protein